MEYGRFTLAAALTRVQMPLLCLCDLACPCSGPQIANPSNSKIPKTLYQVAASLERREMTT